MTRDFANYNAPIKRCDFADIMAAALPAAALSAINDIEQIPDVAKSEVYAGGVYTLYRAGVLTGNNARGTFGPETSISCATAAAIVTRMADSALRQSVTLTACNKMQTKRKLLREQQLPLFMRRYYFKSKFFS